MNVVASVATQPLDRLAMTRLALEFNADSNRLSVGADPPRADMRHEGTGATDPGGWIGR